MQAASTHEMIDAALDGLGVEALELRPLGNVLDALPCRDEAQKPPSNGRRTETLGDVHKRD